MPELEVEDLFEMCDQCNGTGTPQIKGRAIFPECGITKDDPLDDRCDKCKGCGGQLTPTGETILKFIEWFKRTEQISSPF